MMGVKQNEQRQEEARRRGETRKRRGEDKVGREEAFSNTAPLPSLQRMAQTQLKIPARGSHCYSCWGKEQWQPLCKDNKVPEGLKIMKFNPVC